MVTSHGAGETDKVARSFVTLLRPATPTVARSRSLPSRAYSVRKSQAPTVSEASLASEDRGIASATPRCSCAFQPAPEGFR
ncbi:hypothetical protein NDU88_005853 [Pleurodeles waltl]|uniref:Uncharacterized protein n=1 Tax=Pleurodeles waltl TaxID=8319 RepID=A0AAV7RN93_PLEWA|nr:hypothetical protein NDU88_005853 [Pleurodeles waltl]